MPCFRPQKVYRHKDVNPSGRRSITWNPRESNGGESFEIPCRGCIGCRLERSKQWAVRMKHEASLYDDNCFITLTYDDPHLRWVPLTDGFEGQTLHTPDFQKFMKRLRKRFSPRTVRFFHAGEYGDLTGRPHYHACLFNLDFSDKYEWRTERGNKYYRSETLEALWPFGNSEISDLTFASAAYVARYICKKQTGERAEKYYEGRKPEYATMSRRPGIGRDWFDKFHGDCFPKDFVTVDGVKVRPPKYYFQQFEKLEPELAEELKFSRELAARTPQQRENNTRERLFVREFIQEERAKQLKRSLK